MATPHVTKGGLWPCVAAGDRRERSKYVSGSGGETQDGESTRSVSKGRYRYKREVWLGGYYAEGAL